MSLGADLLALVALLPAMTGPVTGGPAAESDTPLVLALCSGGSMAMSPSGERAPGPVTQPCCAKGCHRDERRRRQRAIDREQ